MKKIFTATLLIVFLFCLSAKAQFTGCYAASNWTVNSANTNGFLYSTTNYFDIVADTDQSGNSAQGVDCSTTNNGNVSVCIAIPASGTIQFNWTWTGGNNATLLTEPFGYCINGTPTDLTNNTTYTGTANVPVTMGDNFCFVLSSQYANSHPTLFTHININAFSGPCSPTEVSELLSDKVIFIPASFSNTFTVKGTSVSGTLAVLDVAGKEITRQQAQESETAISTGNFAPGVYMVAYVEGNKRLFVRAVKF